MARWVAQLQTRRHTPCRPQGSRDGQLGKGRSDAGVSGRQLGEGGADGLGEEVLADAGTEPGVTFVDLDLSQVEKARARVPSITHDRAFDGP